MKKEGLIILGIILLISVIGYISAACTDSDGGINYYVKGYVSNPNDPTLAPVYDHCVNNTLFELYCNNDVVSVADGYNCPNGCKDGACFPYYNNTDYRSQIKCAEGFIKINQTSCYSSSKNCIVDYVKSLTGKQECVNNCDCLYNTLNYTNCPDGFVQTDRNTCYSESLNCSATFERKISGEWICTNNCDCLSNLTNISTCNGCILNNKCLDYGYRNQGDYCDETSSNFITQKTPNSACQNNFECNSNICVNNQCVSGSLLQKILDWFSHLFGGK